MLNVNPSRRADITAICSHWWVDEGQSEPCLDIAEELANQTPVRLDLLLSLAPPAVSNDKLLIPDSVSFHVILFFFSMYVILGCLNYIKLFVMLTISGFKYMNRLTIQTSQYIQLSNGSHQN